MKPDREAPGPQATDTHCPYCALQCGMALVSPAPGHRLEVALREFAVNRGAGSEVRLTPRRGSATFRARLSTAMRLDTLFVAFHVGGAGRANTLTHAALDPVSRIPEFKIAAVRMEVGDARCDDRLP